MQNSFSKKIRINLNSLLSACSLPSARDHSNIILGVPRSNHKEQSKFKDNVTKKKKLLVKMKNNFFLVIVNKNNNDN